MRVVLDTNILVSALLVQLSPPAVIYRAWQEGFFTLLARLRRQQLVQYRKDLLGKADRLVLRRLLTPAVHSADDTHQ